MSKSSVIFVCLGNICRSPMSEGVFRQVVEEAGHGPQFLIDSAATGNWHPNSPPDGRAQAKLLERGIDISHQRARQIQQVDFERFDHVLCMDDMNYSDLMKMAAPSHHSKIRKFLEFASDLDVEDVPDPYYGGPEGFNHVLDLVDTASRKLHQAITAEWKK